MTTKELLQRLKTDDVVLFGAGFVAEMFYRALEQNGLDARVRACAVTEARKGQMFHGIPVRPLHGIEFLENTLLCVAVHEAAEDSLREILPINGIETVWVYSNLFELLYGTSLHTAPVSLTEILLGQNRGEYWLAVRYAAIRDFLERRAAYPHTKELYLRTLSLHCTRETAENRCMQMEALAESMKREGFRDDCPIRIDQKLRIIDGLHRTACAAYLQIYAIPAAVYPASPVYDRFLGDRNRLPLAILQANGFSTKEISYLQQAQQELEARVKQQ